jgi:carboxypeptidase D
MAAQFVIFLEKWIETFPEYRDDDVQPHPSESINGQLYIAGESYAGQHIPYIAQAILEHNKVHGDVPPFFRPF